MENEKPEGHSHMRTVMDALMNRTNPWRESRQLKPSPLFSLSIKIDALLLDAEQSKDRIRELEGQVAELLAKG